MDLLVIIPGFVFIASFICLFALLKDGYYPNRIILGLYMIGMFSLVILMKNL